MIYRNEQEAYEALGPENTRDTVRIGLGPYIHRVYQFSWNDRRGEGALNFLYFYSLHRQLGVI